MVVLVDANVIINFITARDDPFAESSKKTVELCMQGKYDGYLAFHTVSILWYVIRKMKSEKEARLWLKKLCVLFHIAGASRDRILDAVEQEDFKDFEDCMQDECAQEVSADYLVTCNIKDFAHAKTKVLNPDQFVALFSNGERSDN